jgi:hypothetical protein
MSHYCNIDDRNKDHIKNLIIWLYEEVISAGGDGDALWYSEYFNVNDILPIIEELNTEFKWNVRKENDHISLGLHQEGILITNNKKHWEGAPSWQQVKICY